MARVVLRDGCADLHAEVDDLFGWAGFESLDRYLGYLRCMKECHAAVAAAVRPFLNHCFLEGLERDIARLDSDLRDLGGCADGGPASGAIGIESRAQAMGALYVMEGSRLGARLLSRRVSQMLGMSADRGACFLFGDGKAGALRWRQFVSQLDEAIVTKSELDAALAGTRRTFQYILQAGQKEFDGGDNAGRQHSAVR